MMITPCMMSSESEATAHEYSEALQRTRLQASAERLGLTAPVPHRDVAVDASEPHPHPHASVATSDQADMEAEVIAEAAHRATIKRKMSMIGRLPSPHNVPMFDWSGGETDHEEGRSLLAAVVASGEASPLDELLDADAQGGAPPSAPD